MAFCFLLVSINVWRVACVSSKSQVDLFGIRLSMSSYFFELRLAKGSVALGLDFFWHLSSLLICMMFCSIGLQYLPHAQQSCVSHAAVVHSNSESYKDTPCCVTDKIMLQLRFVSSLYFKQVLLVLGHIIISIPYW